MRELPREAFASDKSMRDGLQAYCRECSTEHYRQRREVKGKVVREKAEVSPGREHCRRCGETKPHSQQGRNRTASDGLSTRCRACRAEEGRVGHVKRKYGMTEAGRAESVVSQMGICPICLSARPDHVDHDHATGRVRGVLCFTCDSALGKLRGQPDAIRRAADYVEGIVWKPTLVAPGAYRLPS